MTPTKSRMPLVLCCLLMLAAARSLAAGEPFFFIQLSDPQLGFFAQNANFEQETANFEFAVATVNRLRPAFVVITGDLVHQTGDTSQIAEYKRIASKIDPSIPVYNVAGNHDVGNVPTSENLAAWTKDFGTDHYTFRHQDFVGVILNSNLYATPQETTGPAAAQESWLKNELQKARNAGARHIVIFQHHPWFIKSVDEPTQYFNVPNGRRQSYLSLFHESGVKYLFSGHYHHSAIATDGDIEAITTGAVGKPLRGGMSGLRIAIVREDRIDHRYYTFGEIPNRIDLNAKNPLPPNAAPADR